MTMLKNVTPGPWTAELDRGFIWSVFDRDGRKICSAPDEHTARLIAAAPEIALYLRACEHSSGWEFEWLDLPDNGFNCPALPPDLFARLWAEMEAGK